MTLDQRPKLVFSAIGQFDFRGCTPTLTGVAVPFANVIPVTGPISEISIRVAWDNLRPHLDRMPRPARLRWAGFDGHLADAELEIDGDGTLVLKAFGGTACGPSALVDRCGIVNEPAELTLEDGTTVTTPFTDISQLGSIQRHDGSSFAGCRFELPIWSWMPRGRSWLLVGEIGNVDRPFDDNLVLEAGPGNWSRGHLRLEGRYAWHMVKCGRAVSAVVGISDELPTPKSVGQDLMAMEFVAGRELDLPMLWAVDGEGKVVGGMSLGKRRPGGHNNRCPTPSGRTLEGPDGCWVAPLFRRLVPYLGEDDAFVSTAVAGYMDGLRGHVHAEYLLGQVALEAFCRAVTPSSTATHLVAAPDAWRAWVKDHTEEIGRLAIDGEALKILLNRLNHNVFAAPATKTVQRAFVNWGIELPDLLLREVGRRNDVAHGFLMFDERSGDFQEAADRIGMIQTLLAAAIAKHIGFMGPIVGWERGSGGNLKVPEFWKWADLDEAHQMFACSR